MFNKIKSHFFLLDMKIALDMVLGDLFELPLTSHYDLNK